jgi:hypothetical protein
MSPVRLLGLFVYVTELRRARGNQLHFDHILEVVNVFALPEIHEGKYPRAIIADLEFPRLGPDCLYIAYLVCQQELVSAIRLRPSGHYEQFVCVTDGCTAPSNLNENGIDS